MSLLVAIFISALSFLHLGGTFAVHGGAVDGVSS